MMIKRFFILFMLSISLLKADVQKTESISQEDFKKLESFFDYLIHHSSIGYSLCGEKPVSIEIFPTLSEIPIPYSVNIFLYHQGYSIEWNGLNTWKLYAHLFSSKKFAFRFIEGCNKIVFVNKCAAKEVIEENLDLFHKYLDRTKSADEFLEELCNPKKNDYMLNPHTTILGILLGYGRNNAIAFSNKSCIQKLEPLDLAEQNICLRPFLLPGCLIINNGTNEKENAHILQTLKSARKCLQKKITKGHCFETFLKLFTADD
ncbi:hypothetical protein [Parachlamydia acanthamoebae]|uniref:hypothetical protein n=1 Tax=Parachlamydia acanthamoebae TaxID=83552 RepID=UPI0024E2688C|nr:hypothetical protein [Parachlamydia acanthamoebae]